MQPNPRKLSSDWCWNSCSIGSATFRYCFWLLSGCFFLCKHGNLIISATYMNSYTRTSLAEVDTFEILYRTSMCRNDYLVWPFIIKWLNYIHKFIEVKKRKILKITIEIQIIWYWKKKLIDHLRLNNKKLLILLR